MVAQPRLKLFYAHAWTGLALNAEAHKYHLQFSGTVQAIGAGLRGTGQYVVPDLLAYFPSDTCGYNTQNFLMDFQFDSVIGSDEQIVQFRVLLSFWIRVGRDGNGKLYVENQNTGIRWTSTRTVTSGVVRKLEFLSYHGPQVGGVHTGYFQVWLEGELWLEAEGVDLSAYNWGQIHWHSNTASAFKLGGFALFFGIGGWTDGDVRSDRSGNPQILQLPVNGAGSHTDGTPSAGLNYQCVDESPTSNKTDNVSINGSTNPTFLDSYALTNLPGTVTRVLGLIGFYYCKHSTGGQLSGSRFLRINPAANEYAEGFSRLPYSGAYQPGTAFDSYMVGVWSKSPATGRELTVAEVNGAELGWGPSAAGTLSVSHVYAEVLCYVSPPAATPLPVAQKSLVIHKTHHLCRLWRLEPRWGPPMHFTDHITPIVYLGKTYEPAGGFSSTDVRRELGLKDANVDLSGSITSTKITVDDLRAGRYKGARLTEYVVDYRYPWAGALITRPWTIEPDEVDGEVWKATASGMQQKLLDRAGDAYYPRCRFHVFDDDYPIPASRPTWERGCKLDAFGWQEYGIVNAVTDRRVFSITNVTGTANYWAGGILTFTHTSVGGLTNCTGQIKSHSAGVFQLHLPLPFDVTVLDQMMLWPGCNFLIGTINAGDCEGKFNNVKNFGGFMLIPGTDEATRGRPS